MVPRLSAGPGSSALDRFRNEVRTVRGIPHPDVCLIHGIGEAEWLAFITLEHPDCEDLAVALKRMGRSSGEKALEITRQICLSLAAVDYAVDYVVHDAGIIHRDLQPFDIMIDGRGNVRLMDFGISSAHEDLAAGESAVATPLYMARELFREGKATVSSDIYDLVLFHWTIVYSDGYGLQLQGHSTCP